MPQLILTQALVDGQLAPGDYWDRTLPNFSLRVGKTRRVFEVRVREGGRRVRVMLGRAGDPAVGRLRLKEARRLAAARLGQHADGVMLKPTGADVGAGLQPETATVAQLVTEFLEEHVTEWSPAHASNSRMYGAHLTAAHGATLARALSRHQLKTIVRTYAKRAPVSANRYHAFLSKLCRWAVNEELIDRNPIDQLTKVTREESRTRELTPAEIVAFWAALEAITASPASFPHDRALADVWRLRLLTGQRETPLRMLAWAWVNVEEKLLEFPPTVMKGRKGKRLPHLVPLAPRALKLLEARRAIASPVDRLVFGSCPGTTTPPGPSRVAPIALPDFMGKDLRRTAATLMAKHGIPEFVIARVLAHKNTSITGVYNRYEYLAEKRVALETLDRVLTTILEPAQSAAPSVVPFQRG